MTDNMKGKSGMTGIALSAVLNINLAAALLSILVVQTLWRDVNRFVSDATSLSWNWVAVILTATVLLILYTGWNAIRLALMRGRGEQSSLSKADWFIYPAVFLIWNGLIFLLFSEASDAVLVAQITYYYKIISPWFYLFLFALVAALAVRYVRTKKSVSQKLRFALISLLGLLFLALSIGQFRDYYRNGKEPDVQLSGREKFSEQILFNGVEDPKYATFRIPGIVVTRSGIVIAYCEAREGYSDWDDIDVVMKRSMDGGDTWEPRVLLFDTGEGTVNNPVMIAENNTETVHFVYNTDYKRAFYRKSIDGGKTWSDTVEITDTFEAFRPVYDWRVIAFGPGHGLELRNGRLVIPVWLSPGGGGDGHHPQHVSTVYSDDGGKTWKAGEMVAVIGEPGNGEPVGVELSDGRVMVNMRNEDASLGRIYRSVTVCEDGARGWTKPALDSELPDPVCFGSLCRYDEGTILFSNIHAVLKADFRFTVFGMRGPREPLGIRVSYDDGTTWPVSKIYCENEAGYSDITVRDGIILALYEQGWRKKNKYRTKYLKLSRFNMEWVASAEGAPR